MHVAVATPVESTPMISQREVTNSVPEPAPACGPALRARDPTAISGLVTFVAMMVFAFAGPLFFPYKYDTQSDTLSAGPGTDGDLFGTSTLGRDVLLLTMRGIQWSMLIVVVFVIVAGLIGVLYGRWPATSATGWTTC